MEAAAFISIGCAVFVGLIIGILISPRKSRRNTDGDFVEKQSDCGSVRELEERICLLQSQCDDLHRNVDLKEAELSVLRKQVEVVSDSVDRGEFLRMKSESESMIKKLKDEEIEMKKDLEDVELRAQKLKRQLMDKNEENGRLIDEVSVLKRSANDLKLSLDAAKSDLAMTSERLDSFSGTLSFVQDILNAPISHHETERKIEALSSFISVDLHDLYKQYFKDSDQSDYIFNRGLLHWEAVKKKYWIQKTKNIAFIGEFSAGKTSIVNRLFSQDNPNVHLLPVKVEPTTAIPTYICGGGYDNYQFYTPDGIVKVIKEETFLRVRKEVLDNVKGLSNLIKYFIITYNNSYLDGLSILDTPGFSSGDQEDAVRTIEVINECDALFWVIDAEFGTVNRSSLDIIKKNMNRPLYVILNKTDLKAKSEVDAIENQVRKSFDDEGIQVVRYFRFSSEMPMDELMATIASIKKDSSAKEYLIDLEHDFLPSLLSDCQRNYKNASKELDFSNRECDKMKESIINVCRTIKNSSIEAKGIPQWKEHVIRKDRFEMTKSEGDKLKSLLSSISEEKVKELSKLIEEHGELMQKNQQAFAQKKQARYILKLFEDCQGKLNRLISQLD